MLMNRLRWNASLCDFQLKNGLLFLLIRIISMLVFSISLCWPVLHICTMGFLIFTWRARLASRYLSIYPFWLSMMTPPTMMMMTFLEEKRFFSWTLVGHAQIHRPLLLPHPTTNQKPTHSKNNSVYHLESKKARKRKSEIFSPPSLSRLSFYLAPFSYCGRLW